MRFGRRFPRALGKVLIHPSFAHRWDMSHGDILPSLKGKSQGREKVFIPSRKSHLRGCMGHGALLGVGWGGSARRAAGRTPQDAATSRPPGEAQKPLQYENGG